MSTSGGACAAWALDASSCAFSASTASARTWRSSTCWLRSVSRSARSCAISRACCSSSALRACCSLAAASAAALAAASSAGDCGPKGAAASDPLVGGAVWGVPAVWAAAVVDAADTRQTTQYLAHLPNALFAKFNDHRVKRTHRRPSPARAERDGSEGCVDLPLRAGRGRERRRRARRRDAAGRRRVDDGQVHGRSAADAGAGAHGRRRAARPAASSASTAASRASRSPGRRRSPAAPPARRARRRCATSRATGRCAAGRARPAAPPVPPPLPPALLPPVPVECCSYPTSRPSRRSRSARPPRRNFSDVYDMFKIPFTRRSRGGSSCRQCRCWCRCRCTRRSSPASSW